MTASALVYRSKCCFWILCICLQSSFWLCENPDTENATRCKWKVSIYRITRLCNENFEGRGAFQILRWFPCLLCPNRTSCHGKRSPYSSSTLKPQFPFSTTCFICWHTYFGCDFADDMDIFESNTETGEKSWVVGNCIFLWGICNNLLNFFLGFCLWSSTAGFSFYSAVLLPFWELAGLLTKTVIKSLLHSCGPHSAAPSHILLFASFSIMDYRFWMSFEVEPSITIWNLMASSSSLPWKLFGKSNVNYGACYVIVTYHRICI